MDPSFEVPVEYFYALGASLPFSVTNNMTATDRLTLATAPSESKLASALQASIDAGIIPDKIVTSSLPGGMSALQAARRLVALGGARAATQLGDERLYTVSHLATDDVHSLIQQWLNDVDPPGGLTSLPDDPEAYIWKDLLINATPAATLTANVAAQLRLVVCALTGWNDISATVHPLTDFITAISLAPFNVHNTDDLATINTLQWTDFFTANPNFLPPFTQPAGTTVDPNDRIQLFLAYLQRFYAVPVVATPVQTPTADAIPLLDRYGFDPLATFLIDYDNANATPYTFGTSAPDDAAAKAAAAQVFPNDAEAQQWLLQALQVINELVTVTKGVATGVNAAALQFSIIEALYARGFISIASITALDQADFTQALTGSVAFQWAAAIWNNAGGTLQPAGPTPVDFVPVNPGDLCDCVPPPQLSPLGPVQYLRELIDAGPDSTCKTPKEPTAAKKFGSLLKPRRGDVGALLATRANLETPLPVIDLVNECLEYLAAQVAASAGTVTGVGGVVHDTADTQIRDHHLRPPDTDPTPADPYQHNPATVLAALPQYSSPASPVAQPGAYTALATDYTHPDLPYAQPLDVNRTHLAAMDASRYEVMRRFRARITEFVLNDNPAVADPTGFDPTVWRYPPRRNIAHEYLHISADEYHQLFATPIATSAPPPAGELAVWQLYGFPDPTLPPPSGWVDVVIVVSEFLERTGLSYCELVELSQSGFVPIKVRPKPPSGPKPVPVRGDPEPLPECPPCHLDELILYLGATPADVVKALVKLAVFIRLWRLLQKTRCARYTFADLADICTVLGLFTSATITPNPEFIPELVAFQILRDELCLPLREGQIPTGATGITRTTLLALWVDPPSGAQWGWALGELLERLQRYSVERHGCDKREPELIKVLAANLDELSLLCGFDPTNQPDTWHHTPRHTLRFVEVLSKLYASPFTTGEIEFLFTVRPHLDGDDPLPLQSDDDARDDPLELPDDEPRHSLWELRRALLEVEVDEEELERWTWPRIDSWLRDELGYDPGAGPDRLTSLAEHAFPDVVEHYGHSVAPANRRYTTGLNPAVTSPGMWNTDPDSPLSYDPVGKLLEASLPLNDEAVLHILVRQRQLNKNEADALRDLYWMPRLDLAAVGFLFDDPVLADRHLLQEHDEHARWRFFRRHVLLTRERCRVIAAHLARHVGGDPDNDEEDVRRAWLVLKSLYADSNAAKTPPTWEGSQPSGAPPQVTWPTPTAGAFAALLGLRGTGLNAQYFPTSPPSSPPLWSEQTGALDVFGEPRNECNVALPTLIPAIQPAPGIPSSFIQLHNGFAFSDRDGRNLGGAQGFTVGQSGVLLVEHPGRYRFAAGPPTEEGQPPSAERAEHEQWRITLTRGQREWVLLAHDWPNQPDTAHDTELELRRGAYDITIEYARPEPQFDDPDDIHRRRTGFQLKYGGPDTHEDLHTVPFRRLFIAEQTPPEINGDGQGAVGANVLAARYTSSLGDIRRTYQRAYKALLLSARFELSAHRAEDGDSELGFMLAHPDRFAGASYPRTAAGFTQHQAQFNFNFLPVLDNYRPPAPITDDRAAPSTARQAALFDWWERLFDYTQLRRENHEARDHHAHRPRLWRLFAAAAAAKPSDPLQLWPHLTVPLDHNTLVQRYYIPSATPSELDLTASNLEDERWAIRAWKAQRLVHELREAIYSTGIGNARPDWWVADDPSVIEDPATGQSGNDNLTLFVGDALLETGDPRRYHDLATIDDGLRERARHALIAYLCRMNRVTLPDGTFATHAKDLADLLLIDVDAGMGEKATRIDDAITAVQALVERALMRLETGVKLGEEFREVWECRFRTFRIWQACKRRELYPENTIECDELEHARHCEAFQLLEAELRDAALSVPVPAGIQYWADQRPPAHDGLEVLQAQQASTLHLPIAPTTTPTDAAVPTENFGLLGRPEHAGRPSWLSPLQTTPQPTPNPKQPPRRVAQLAAGKGSAPAITTRRAQGAAPDEGSAAKTRRTQAARSDNAAKKAAAPKKSAAPVVAHQLVTPPPAKDGTWPYWIEAAIKLGVRFLRIAAAGEPAGACGFEPREDEGECCCECGEVHPPRVDEYYFWLAKSSYYDPPQDQVADRTNANGSSQWEDPTIFPQLLDWEPGPMVHLHWCRVHDREFGQLRRSADGVALDPTKLTTPPGPPTLELRGRVADSLVFAVDAGIMPNADGGADPNGVTGFKWPPPYTGWQTNPVDNGWRYDLAVDDAVRLPLLVTPPAPVLQPPTLPSPLLFGGLQAYPFFVYFTPGEPVIPLSKFAPAVAVATALVCHCRYHEALRWYERYYDPLTSNNTWTGAQPSPPVARQRAVLLDVLETMLCWGDAVMAAHTEGCPPVGNAPEAFARARVIFDAAARILGKTPKTVLLNGPTAPAQPVSGFKPLDPPLNPRLVMLYERVSDRLGLIHHCETRRRHRYGKLGESLSFWGEDPAHRGHDDDCGCSVCRCCSGCCCCEVACQPESPYRFTHLHAQTMDRIGAVRGFGQALLAAYEKGDAEYLASLRATQEHQLQELTLRIRKDQWRDADWQVQALKQARLSAQNSHDYYKMLIDSFRNPNEKLYEDLMGVAEGLQITAQGFELGAAIAAIMPPGDSYVGTGFFLKIPTNSTLVLALDSAAKAALDVSQDSAMGAQVALTEAGWDRRLSDWNHEVDVFNFEIERLTREILGAERRSDGQLREVGNLQCQIEYTREVDDFLRDKFSNHALYLYHQRHLAGLYRELYGLALGSARQLERAFNLERGHTDEHFICGELWDNLHQGLLAGERLELDVRRMEKAHDDCDRREYELTKHISLQREFPLAFLQLKVTGECEIEVPEWMFDKDYPSHYMRRLKTVSLTIPCVTGPYTGVHCRLTLLSSTTRTKPWLHGPVERCCDEKHERCHCCGDGADRARDEREAEGYRALPDDPRIYRSYSATEAIATSNGANDAGLFQVNFDDPRYLPFEFNGAVSHWRIELPPENNQFPLETLTDLIMQLNYTSREGGERLRRAASAAACCRLPGDGLRLFDVRHEFPDAWPALRQCDEEREQRRLPLQFWPTMFPFVPGRRVRWIDRLVIVFAAPDSDPGRHHLLRFWQQGDDHDDVEEFECIAIGKWPGYFYGVISLERPLGPLNPERAAECWFEFPVSAGEICSAYVIAHYDAQCWPRCGVPRPGECCEEENDRGSSR